MYVVCYLNVRCTYSTALGEVVRIIKQRLKKKMKLKTFTSHFVSYDLSCCFTKIH